MNCGDEAGASSGHLDWRFSQVALVKKSKKLCDLYENDSVFDKFECCLNGDGLRVATCSYSNLQLWKQAKTQLGNKLVLARRQVTTPARPSRPSLSSTARVVRRGAETPGSNKNGNTFDHTTKLLHPTED